MFNNSSNLYGSEWLAVVFTNRNKNYGAYSLRSQSDYTTMKALFIAAPLFIMLFVGPVIYGKIFKEDVVIGDIYHTPVRIEKIYELKKEEVKKEEPIKAKPLAQQKVKSINLSSNIKLVENPPVEAPTTEQLKNVVIASATVEGIEGQHNLIEPIVTTTGNGGGGTAPVGTGNEILETSGVDVYPEFPGGMAAWAKYIQRNLRYPSMAQEENIQGKVYLSFVVEKDGSITDVKVVKGIGYGCDDEAKRVIQKSPKWHAGKQNNQSVRVRYNMPISYALQ